VDPIQVGYVARAHGLRGEVRVHLHTPGSTTLLGLERAWIGGQERRIVAVRPTPGAVLLLLEGVSDRDAAEALRGSVVEVDRADIPLEEGEYLLGDLPGCAVVDPDGQALGRVADIIQGAQPILVIHHDDNVDSDDESGGRELLVPAVPQFVLEVDVGGRRVVVAVPEGLSWEPRRR
jgi:16S rRNA processing protein RimM